jgi:hypothetical protein
VWRWRLPDSVLRTALMASGTSSSCVRTLYAYCVIPHTPGMAAELRESS